MTRTKQATCTVARKTKQIVKLRKAARWVGNQASRNNQQIKHLTNQEAIVAGRMVRQAKRR